MGIHNFIQFLISLLFGGFYYVGSKRPYRKKFFEHGTLTQLFSYKGGGIVGKKQKCEVYSRVVGYLSPVSEWNEGKKEEWGDRETYSNPKKD